MKKSPPKKMKYVAAAVGIFVLAGLALFSTATYMPYKIDLRDDGGCEDDKVQTISKCEDLRQRFGDKEGDGCYAGAAIENHDYCTCLNAKTVGGASSCYMFAAIENNDPASCEYLRSVRDRGHCYEMIAVRRNDLSLCEASPRRDGCVSAMAESRIDESLCKMIINQELNAQCNRDVLYQIRLKERAAAEKPVKMEQRFLLDTTNAYTLKGTYTELRADEMGALNKMLCFNVDTASFAQLPFQNVDAGQRSFFCFDDQPAAKTALQINEDVFVAPSCASISGSATILISNYTVDTFEAEVVNKAHLDSVVKSTSPKCFK